MKPENDEPLDIDATAKQLAELRRLDVAETDLEALTATVAEEWIANGCRVSAHAFLMAIDRLVAGFDRATGMTV